jgi:hypothetical protein
MTDEAMISGEEEISIFMRQLRQSIKCEAIHRHVDRSREQRTFKEPNPMDVVVIRHDSLYYPTPSRMTLSFILSTWSHLTTRSDKGWNKGS